MRKFYRHLRRSLLAGLLPAAMAFPAMAQSFQRVRYADDVEPARAAGSQKTIQPRTGERLWPVKQSAPQPQQQQPQQQPDGRYIRNRSAADNADRVTTAEYQSRTGQPNNVRYASEQRPRDAKQRFAPVRHADDRRFAPAVTGRRQPIRQPIQPVQHMALGGRPLPNEILAMPKVRETMDVVHHRSQLLIARGNISRTAIADDSVIDVVQFSPREISIIGVGLGSTTLTIWFDNNPNPLIYLVKTIRDPDVDEQLRIDYGKLERKLAALFPNSKVFLIPLSGKIVVKGQARGAREAARILQIVRNEVINQNGSLFGPQPAGAFSAGAAGVGGIAQVGYRGPRAFPGSQAGVNGGSVAGAGAGFGAFDLASSYIVNMLEVPGEFQVMLRVRIAELSRSQLQRMGIDFSYLFNNGRHAVSYALGGIPSTITGIFENGEIGVLIDWLASNGTAKILSEPVITVLSGHTASMLSGGEFAVPTIVGIGGAQGQQTSFRGFGTSLFVTPTVSDKDLIRMTIVPEFSTINQGNSVNGIPGVDARRVQTTVELREGQTIAIAGLIAHQMSTEVTRIPWLSDLPYIGPKLFAAKRSTMEETELLILVTPQLVRPMDADEVPPVPGWYVTPPTDRDLYHRGMTEGAPDLEYYQVAPYGRGAGMGEPVGYRLHNPSPATPGYPPAVTDPYGASRHGMPAGPPVWKGQPGPRPPQGPPPGPTHNQMPPRRYVPNQNSPPNYRNPVPPPQYNQPPGGLSPNRGNPSGTFDQSTYQAPNSDGLPGSYPGNTTPPQQEPRSFGNLFGLRR